MRIIGGSARGRRLFAPPGENTRPTADRVREALFNILAARLDGARVLDLFGGSGALALEALSRGAACAVIGDKDPGAVSVIRRNALSVLGEAELPRVKIVCRDYRALLASLAEPFDLVFLDPPYRMQEAYGNAMAQMQQRNLLAPDARIVAEMAAGADGGSLAVETAGVAADGVSVEITAADGAPDDPPDTQ